MIEQTAFFTCNKSKVSWNIILVFTCSVTHTHTHTHVNTDTHTHINTDMDMHKTLTHTNTHTCKHRHTNTRTRLKPRHTHACKDVLLCTIATSRSRVSTFSINVQQHHNTLNSSLILRMSLGWIGFVYASQVILCKILFVRSGGGKFVVITNKYGCPYEAVLCRNTYPHRASCTCKSDEATCMLASVV